MTPQQLIDFAWLSEQAHNVAITCSSGVGPVKAIGLSLAGLLQEEWAARFPELAQAQTAKDAARRAASLATMAVEGPKGWTTLHNRALAYGGVTSDDATKEIAWLVEFTKMIPCPACRSSFGSIVRKNPPTLLSGAQAYFAWTVLIHNEVSKKINLQNPTLPPKVIYTLDEALATWKK